MYHLSVVIPLLDADYCIYRFLLYFQYLKFYIVGTYVKLYFFFSYNENIYHISASKWHPSLQIAKAQDSTHLHHNIHAKESKEYFLEILVVADKTMVAYHKNMDLELYILTIFNMVWAINYILLCPHVMKIVYFGQTVSLFTKLNI
jgi:hypothetical protein